MASSDNDARGKRSRGAHGALRRRWLVNEEKTMKRHSRYT